MKFIARKIWLTTHLYIGLTAGAIFALSGVTGSLLVFHRNLDEQLNADQMLTSNIGEPRPMAEIVSAACLSHPDLPVATSIHLPRTANGVFSVRYKNGEDDAAEVEVFVDPATAKPLGKRVRDTGLMATVFRLHSQLLIGSVGETVLGVVGLLVLISVISGVMLWWPMLCSGLRNALCIRHSKFAFDLHKTLGGLSAALLFFIAITGVIMIFGDRLRPVIGYFSPVTKLPRKVDSTFNQSSQTPLTLEQAAAVAAETMPNCRLMSIDLPQGPLGTYRVFVRQAGEVGDLRGVGRVWIDQYSGAVLATRDWRTFTAADTFYRVQLALHSGDAFGIVGRCLFFLTGLCPMALYITGCTLWWRRRQAKYRKQRTEQSDQTSDQLSTASQESRLHGGFGTSSKPRPRGQVTRLPAGVGTTKQLM